MSDLYFFEVVWEVACLREAEWQTGKCTLRSAVRVFSDTLFRFGPDLLEVEDPYVHPDLNELISWKEKNALADLSNSRYRNISGEPRVMVAGHGQRISEREVLYELWEDSDLQILTAEMFLIEPLIFCHAFRALLDFVRSAHFSGAVADSREIAFLNARAPLKVKKKSRRIEPVLSSEAIITGENGLTFGINLYGELHHTSFPDPGVRYALLVPEEENFREKSIQANQVPAGLRTGKNLGGTPGVTVRTPGKPDKDYVVLPTTPEQGEPGKTASALASGFLAHMNFCEEPSGLLWIF